MVIYARGGSEGMAVEAARRTQGEQHSRNELPPLSPPSALQSLSFYEYANLVSVCSIMCVQ